MMVFINDILKKTVLIFLHVSNIVLLYIYYLQTVFVPKSVLTESQAGSGSKLFGTLRPKEKYALFPITCPKFLGSVHVGRQTFFLYKIFFFVLKKYENP